MPKQLDIYWTDLEPAIGRETRKNRPSVILQSNLTLKRSHTIITAPLLPNHKEWPFAVNITPSDSNGLDIERYINLMHIRSLDISRLGNKQGRLEASYLDDIHDKLALIFGMDSPF